MTFLLGLLAIGIGALLVGWGYRFLLYLIPVYGFLVGLVSGGYLADTLFKTGFLNDVAGWGFGIGLGIAFALASYAIAWIGLVFLATGLGLGLGEGIVAALGIQNEILSLLIALVVVAAAIILVARYQATKWFLIVLSAIAGGTTLVAGILLLLGRIALADVGHGAIAAYFRDGSNGWLWAALAAVISAAGVYVQAKVTAKDLEFDIDVRASLGRLRTT